ncbi:MAG: autotransporter-associated beta strand repeat-containing protein [Chthoniobacterales bacterium]|nr:autotransporter-associated beta strand repeat-containing protein [Chthoniobacterales bacterium]
MRNLPTLFAVPARLLATGSALLLISAPPLAHAGTNGTWITNASGNWTNTANWSNGIYATGADANAYFDAIDASSTRNITNSVNNTIGNFYGGDTGGTAVAWRLVGAGTITFDTTSGTPTISNSVTVTISNIIAGNDGLLKTGSGILQLGGANVFTGGLTIEQDRVRLVTNNVLEDTTIVTFADNTNSRFFELDNGANETIGGLNATSTSGNRVVQGVSGSLAAPTLTLNVDGGASYTFNHIVRDTASGVSNSIALSIVKSGSGTQVFSGGSVVAYSGTTTVNGGVLEFAGATVNNNTAISIGTNGTMRFNTTTNASRTNTISGAGALVKTGAGTLTISNTTHTGGTTVEAGVLALASGGDNRLSTNGSVAISNGATLDLGGNGQILKVLTGAGTVTNSAGTLELNIGSGTNNVFAGALVGGGALTKSGDGTVTLSGTNTHTGTTTVSGGVLHLATSGGGGAASTTNVVVSTGAVLLISQGEQVNNSASVSLSGGTITLSGAVSETFGDLAMSGDSFLNYGGTEGAHFIKFGSLTLNDFTLGISNFVLGNKLQYSAADYAEGEALANTFDFTSSADRGFSFNGGVFTITAIPEPSTIVAALGLLGVCLWPVRRRLLSCLSGS